MTEDMNPSHLTLAQNHMKTTFSFTISCEPSRLRGAEQTLDEAHHRVTELENELSEFLEHSPVYQLNQAAPGVEIALPDSAIDLLRIGSRLSERTGNAFSCTAKTPPQFRNALTWDEQARTATRLHSQVRVGFGAIGKGYALDQVRALIEQAGFVDFMLNAGGSSLILSGFSSPETPWRWGWSWGRDADGDSVGISFSHASALPVAIGVSGRHEKGDHLLDPVLGRPVAGMQSALVAQTSATEADALSTALFVGGWDKALAHFVNLETPPALAIIDDEQIPRWNGPFQRLWGAIVSLICCFLVTPPAWGDDGAVDLNDLGVEDFTPYLFDRNNWWILAPVAMLVIVLIHLKDSRPKTRPQSNPEEDQ